MQYDPEAIDAALKHAFDWYSGERRRIMQPGSNHWHLSAADRLANRQYLASLWLDYCDYADAVRINYGSKWP